ncbi:MAG: hypothetical protein UGF89_11255 [Acutalibacteraceae bacterium]|nr:hypothetical protein [Acutalibacteraceae bacterium]
MFDCFVVEKTSKGGNNYIALEIDLGCDYKKLVFLDPAEKAIVKMALGNDE